MLCHRLGRVGVPDVLELALGILLLAQLEIGAGDLGAGLRVIRINGEDAFERENRLRILADTKSRRAEQEVVFRVACALRLERDEEVVGRLRVAVFELLLGRQQKLVGSQSSQWYNECEQEKQSEASCLPHGSS